MLTMPKGRMTGPFGVTNPLPDERAAVLKQYEQYAYQIAYYLLQDEAMARRAAEDTLTELYRQDSFFDLSGHGQGASVKAASMRHALKEKARAL